MRLPVNLGIFLLVMVAGTGISAGPPKFHQMPTAGELNAAVEALVTESETTLRRDARGRVSSVQLFGTPMEVRYVGDHVEAIRVGSSWLPVREDRLGNERTGGSCIWAHQANCWAASGSSSRSWLKPMLRASCLGLTRSSNGLPSIAPMTG